MHFPAACSSHPNFSLSQFFFTFRPPGQHPSGLAPAWPGPALPHAGGLARPARPAPARPGPICRSLSNSFSLFQFFSTFGRPGRRPSLRPWPGPAWPWPGRAGPALYVGAYPVFFHFPSFFSLSAARAADPVFVPGQAPPGPVCRSLSNSFPLFQFFFTFDQQVKKN